MFVSARTLPGASIDLLATFFDDSLHFVGFFRRETSERAGNTADLVIDLDGYSVTTGAGGLSL
jgi:hypothetical protein